MKPFGVLVKDNFFTPEEMELIWCELTLMAQANVLGGPQDTRSATVDGEILKQNRGIFLNRFYVDVQHSPLFQASRRIFDGLTEEFSELGFANYSVLSTRNSNFLLQYYEDSDHYKAHKDQCVTTVLYWFCKEPKAFEGGQLYFPLLDETVEFQNNRMVMFPSWAEHAVKPVKMLDKGNLLGRFSVTQFLTF